MNLLSRTSIAIVLIMIIMQAGCKPADTSPGTYKGDQLHFGQGGGFTGAITHYALLDDGRLFQKAFRDTVFTYEETWDRGFVSQMFKNYHSLGLDSLEHYHPGDIYYFIEYHAPTRKIHRISWGHSGHSPDDNIISFYNLLYKSTNSKS